MEATISSALTPHKICLQQGSHKLLTRCLLALLSGVLLALCFLFESLYFIAWVAFVPLLIALAEITYRQAYIVGLLCGLILSIIASYWIAEFISNLKGLSVFVSLSIALLPWVLAAHIIVCIALSFVWLRRNTNISEVIIFPVVVSVFFAVFPSLFSIQIGATQSRFLLAIQAVEYFGVFGLDAIIALANIVIWRLISSKNMDRPTVCAIVMVGLWFGAGAVLLIKYTVDEQSWGVANVGFIQPGDQPSIPIPAPAKGFSYAYPVEMHITEALAAKGAEVVVWPESRFKGYFRYAHVAASFQQRAGALNTSIVFQDMERTAERGQIKKYNTTVYIDKHGIQQQLYRKRKLIFGGETLPLATEVPALRRLAKNVFGDFFGDLSAGETAAEFSFDHFSMVPILCYEALFPRLVARSVKKTRKGTILVVQSNNSWFGRTRQPFQHVNTTVLRSVENRVPMVHVLNGGPSVVVMPSGRRLFATEFAQKAGYLVSVPYLNITNTSFFSRYPNAFFHFVSLLLVWMIFSALLTKGTSIN